MMKPSTGVLLRRPFSSPLRSYSSADALSSVSSSSSSAASAGEVAKNSSLPAASSTLSPKGLAALEECLELLPDPDVAKDTSSITVISAALREDVTKVATPADLTADMDSSLPSTLRSSFGAPSSPSSTPAATPRVGWVSTPSSTIPRDLHHRHRYRFRCPERRVVFNVPASAESQVAAAADLTTGNEAPLREPLNTIIAELHGDGDLSPLSKRLRAALAEAATIELAPAATARRLRRAAFRGKVRIAVLAATLAFMVATDVALAVHLLTRRKNDWVLPPT